MQDLIDEIKLHLADKEKFHETLSMIDRSYQRGQFGFFRYQQLRHKLLQGKTKKEWDDYFDSYIFSLLKQIEFFNSKIFYDVFTDRTDLKLKIPEKVVKVRKKLPALVALPKPVVAPLEEEVKPLIIRKVHKKPAVKEKEKAAHPEKVTKPIDLSATKEEVPPEALGEELSAQEITPPEGDVLEAEVVGEVPVSGDAGLAQDLSAEEEPVVEVEAEVARDIPQAEDLEPEAVEGEGRKTLAKVLFGDEEKEKEKEEGKKRKSFLSSLFGRSRKEEVLPWLAAQQKQRSLWQSVKEMFSPKK
ncbi:hypothetical protein D6764_02215, partial [Candidatus Woesearchaeota archaeon]